MTVSKPRPRLVVLGDLVLDVVLAPDRPIVSGTDVPGRVAIRQGGSAANTARWLARLGARVTLVSAVGRDAAGRALVEAVRGDGVTARVVRVAGARTGRIGVLVTPGGERSFVADRGAADALSPEDLRPAWFAGLDHLHLPAYSLLDPPLGQAGRRAIELARGAGATVSVDLASVGPLLAHGRRRALDIVRDTSPDLLFATASEATAVAGGQGTEMLLELVPIVVLKRGVEGASVLVRASRAEGISLASSRLDVATRPLQATDTTGAGDAFDAGFMVAWLASRVDHVGGTIALRRGALAGHRAAARQLSAPREELRLG